MSLGGARLLAANRLCNGGRMEESVSMYIEALESADIDRRSKFVAFYSLGNVYLSLGESRKACRAWLNALKIEEGRNDRATVALQAGTIFFKDNNLTEAVDSFRLAIEYDSPETKITRIAHQRLGAAIRERGAAQKIPNKKLTQQQKRSRSPSLTTVNSWNHH